MFRSPPHRVSTRSAHLVTPSTGSNSIEPIQKQLRITRSLNQPIVLRSNEALLNALGNCSQHRIEEPANV